MWWTNFLVPCRDCTIDCLAAFTYCFKSSNHQFLSPLLTLLSTSRLKLRLLQANSFCQRQEPYLPLFSSFQTFSSAEQTVEWPAASSNQLANKLFVFTPYAPAYTCVPSHMIVHFRILRWSKLDRCGRIFNGRLLMWAIIGALRYKHSGNKWLLKTPAYAHLFFDSSRLIRCCTLLCEAYVLSIAAAFDPPTQNTQTG